MRRLISIFCITLLVLTMAVPTLSLASDAEAIEFAPVEEAIIEEQVEETVEETTEDSEEILEEVYDGFSLTPGEAPVINLGDDEITIDNKSYVKASTLKGPYTFDGDDASAEFTDLYSGGDFAVGNKEVADFATKSGLTDTDGHGNVVSIPATEGNGTARMYNSVVTGGIFALTYDILYTQGNNTGNIFSHYTDYSVNGQNNSNSTGLRSAFAYGTNCFKYRGETIASFTDNQWKRVAILIDIDADMYHFIIDDVYFGERPIQNNSGDLCDLTAVRQFRLFVRGTGDTYLDNVAVYHYQTAYTASISQPHYAKNSVWNLTFDNAMNSDTLLAEANPISIVDAEENAIDFTVGQYDETSKVLPITIDENLKPGTSYKVTVASTVSTKSGFSYPVGEEIVLNITVPNTEYGVEPLSLVSCTIDNIASKAGESVNVNIPLRTTSSVDSNLVLALYVDGALRSISAKPIAAGAAEANNTLSINVPAEVGTKYEVRALLLGENFKVLDTAALAN